MTPILIASANICSDFILATILTIIRRALDLIQLIVPIILIVSGSVQLVKMVMNIIIVKVLKDLVIIIKKVLIN